MSNLDKRYTLKLDTKGTFFNPTPQFSLSDNETSDMLIRVTNNNKLIDMKGVIVVMVVIDPNGIMHSDFVELQRAEEGLLYCNLNQSLKNVDGTWKARLMCIYGEERIVTSTFSYKVNTDEFVQLNQDVVTDDRFGTLTEMLSRLSTIENTELARQQAETGRVEAEKQREIVKEKLISDIEKLILDTNSKVDDNLLENSNKVDKLISDTTTKIDSYKTEKDEAIQQDLQLYKQETTKNIDDYKLSKDIEINKNLSDYKTSTTTDIETYKNNKNAEINQYKTEKDLEIDTYVAAKNNDIDNYKKAKDLLIDDKLKEVDASEKSRAEAETLRQEQHTEREAFLNGFESRVNANEAKNTEQDGRLNSVEYISKRQDVALSGLLNESGDKRLAITGEGNHLKLEHSKDGVVEVNSVVGNTLVNLQPSAIPRFHIGLGGDSLDAYTVQTDNNYIKITGNGINPPAYRYINMGRIAFEMYKPSTTYTLTFSKLKGIKSIMLQNGAATSTMLTANIKPTEGVLTYTMTTRDSFISDSQILYLLVDNTLTDLDVEVKNPVILEGDYTSKPIPNEYFEGMKSTFEDCLVTQEMIDAGTEKAENLGKYKGELKVVGKNKFHYNIPSHYINVEKLYNGYKLILSPEDAVKGKSFYTERVSIKKHTKYIISAKIDLSRSTIEPDTVGANIDIVDGATRTWIYGSALATTKGVTNIKNRFDSGNCDSIRLQFFVRAKISGEVRFIDIQIEEDPQPDMPTTPSPYEPYKESKQTLYLDEPLYKDNELCIHNGQLGYWKKSVTRLFKGGKDEQFILNDANARVNTLSFQIPLNLKVENGTEILNTFAPSLSSGLSQVDYECVQTYNDNFLIRINKNKLSTQDSEGLRQHLQVNNVQICFNVLEPIFVPILENTQQWILDSFNDCTLFIESNIPATSISATYSGNVVSVVTLEKVQYQQDSVNLDNAYRLTVLEIASGGVI